MENVSNTSSSSGSSFLVKVWNLGSLFHCIWQFGVFAEEFTGAFTVNFMLKIVITFFFFGGGQIWTERPYKLVLNCIKSSYHNNFRFSQKKRSWLLALALSTHFSSFRSYSVVFHEICRQLAFLGNQNLSFQSHPCKIFASDACFSYALWG